MKNNTAYMRAVEPGKKTDTAISDKLRLYVNHYTEKIRKAVEGGMSADDAFRKIKPDVTKLTPEDLIGLLWENQHIGRWEIPKGSIDLYSALEGILQKVVYQAVVLWWGKQKTEPKARQTSPTEKTVVKDKSQDEVVTKVEPKGASAQNHEVVRYAGHVYRRVQLP